MQHWQSCLAGGVRSARGETPAPGAFLRANGGTIFIDELNSMPLELQPKLLRALESRSVKAVGSDTPRAVDVRVVAACGSDLAAEVQAGKFRADLFYRLSVVHVQIPPLRRRREDIGPIVRRVMSRLGIPDPGPIEGQNLERLTAHSWPGNVRELRNVIEARRGDVRHAESPFLRPAPPDRRRGPARGPADPHRGVVRGGQGAAPGLVREALHSLK